MKNNKTFKLALIASAVSLAVNTPLVFAENQNEEEIEKIAVTGSHIRRTDMEGPSPITSIDAEEIAKTGVSDLIGLFEKMPISGQGTFSTQANSSDDTANGGSSVSLRGLGADSTLILVNGRRVSVSPFAKNIDTAFVDINKIPLAAIKRVEIVKDGASATYGSDAVAGVINIILKDNFDGVQVTAKVGDTSDGGGETNNLSFIWGNSDDKSSHTFVFDYFDREEILYGDRAFAATSNQAARTGDPLATDFRSSSGIPGTIALRSDPTNRIPDTFGNDACAAEDIVGTLCRYDYAPHMSLVPSSERVTVNYMGRIELNPDHQFFVEFGAQNDKTIIKGAGSPSFNELFMDGDNVNHPFADMPDHEFHGQDLTMRRRMVDIGNRKKENSANYFRTVVGMEGDLSNDWFYNAAMTYIKSESTERGIDGFPNSRRVQEAIDSGLWNPFEPSSNTQEALDYIETTTTRIGKSTSKSFAATVNGPVGEMAGGEIMLAIGTEYREDTISDNPDDQYLRGEVFGTEATQANGQRDNLAIYSELRLPMADSFELQFAVRFEDYSDFGQTTDPKIAFIWNPMDNLSFRGSYGTAFRAPSLHQIGLGDTQESPNLVDTVRCNAVGNVNKACDLQEYTAILSGNPDLKPEESTSYNLGVIFEASEALDFSIDYYDYDIENIITKDTQYKFTNFGTDSSVVVRLPSDDPNDPGEVVLIYDKYENLGNITTSGIDLNLNYKLPTEMGDFAITYNLNYVLDYEDFRPTAGVFATEGDFERPEYRWTLAGNFTNESWSARAAVNYISSFQQDSAIREYETGKFLPDVDAMTTVDLTVSYLGLEDTAVTLGITNLFNEEPPFSYHDFMGYVTNVHSGIGRSMYVQMSYSF